MKLSALIERLEEIREELQYLHGEDFDPVILAAYQQNYPLAGVIHGAAVCNDDERDEATVWIAIGGAPATGSPYAPRAAFEVDA